MNTNTTSCIRPSAFTETTQYLLVFGLLWFAKILSFLICFLGFKKNRIRINLQHIGLKYQGAFFTFYQNLIQNLIFDLFVFMFFSRLLPIWIDEDSQDLINRIKGLESSHLMLGMHFGNHELMSSVVNQMGVSFVASTLPLKKNWAQQKLVQKRKKLGILFQNFKNFREVLRLIQKNHSIGVMIDQDPKKLSSIPGKCMGKACKVNALPQMILNSSSLTPLALVLVREKKRYVLYVQELDCKCWQAQAEECFDRFIQAYPEQWYGWLHRRFFSVGLKYDVK